MRVLVVLLLAAWPTLLGAVPVIDAAGVMNAASLLPPGLPGGGLAPGAQFVVQGQQLGPAPAAKSGEPVEELGGVTVRIRVGRREWQAELLEAGRNEIRGVVPAKVASGQAAVVVEYLGVSSAPVYTKVVPASAGIFTVVEGGNGPAVAEIMEPGDEVTLRATGLGAEDGRSPEPEVFLGSLRIAAVQVERGAECCGIDHVTFTIPEDAPAGCNVPVQLRNGGYITSNTASISIAPLAPYCGDVDSVYGALSLGGQAGFAIPFRLSIDHEIGQGGSVATVGDALVAGFRSGAPGPGANRLLYPPPPGTCTLYSAAAGVGNLEEGVRRSILAGTVVQDGGDLDVWIGDGPRKTVVRVPLRDDYEYGLLGGAMPDRLDGEEPLFLRPGEVAVAASGGAGVRPFEIRVQFPEPIVWTNRAEARVVDRSREFEVRWKVGESSQLVAVAGLSIDKPAKAAAAFLCVAEPGARSFRIPAPILQSLPATHVRTGESIGYVVLGTIPAGADILFTVGGLSKMFGVGLSADGRTVRFR